MNYSLFIVLTTAFTASFWKSKSLASSFLTPKALSDYEDSFIYRDLEYITVNKLLSYDLAEVYCEKILSGQLARFSDQASLNFMAEALSEINVVSDHMWVNAKKNNDRWNWYRNGKKYIEVDEKILNDHMFRRVHNNSRDAPRYCMAFSRQNFDKPLLVDLDCNLLRSFVCVRQPTDSANQTTHPGWIIVGKRQYKIFNERVSNSFANFRCSQHDKTAKLAVIPSLIEAKILARYLLIGRPSLENAWIGLQYLKPQGWQFPQENFILPELRSDPTNNSGLVYPPWRSKHPKKAGCGLLDRHLSKNVLFVEAHCNRARPYICYKMAKKDEDTFVLFTEFADYNYRLYLKTLTWHDAQKFCQAHDNGILAEPLNKQHVDDYIHMMGDFRVSVRHLWIGGLYYDSEWTYPSNNDPVKIIGGKHWITNSTYEEDVEHVNLCLNIDRENHGEALIYGTQCSYPQYFLCQYSKDQTNLDVVHDESVVSDRPDVTEPPKRPKVTWRPFISPRPVVSRRPKVTQRPLPFNIPGGNTRPERPYQLHQPHQPHQSHQSHQSHQPHQPSAFDSFQPADDDEFDELHENPFDGQGDVIASKVFPIGKKHNDSNKSNSSKELNEPDLSDKPQPQVSNKSEAFNETEMSAKAKKFDHQVDGFEELEFPLPLVNSETQSFRSVERDGNNDSVITDADKGSNNSKISDTPETAITDEVKGNSYLFTSAERIKLNDSNITDIDKKTNDTETTNKRVPTKFEEIKGLDKLTEFGNSYIFASGGSKFENDSQVADDINKNSSDSKVSDTVKGSNDSTISVQAEKSDEPKISDTDDESDNSTRVKKSNESETSGKASESNYFGTPEVHDDGSDYSELFNIAELMDSIKKPDKKSNETDSFHITENDGSEILNTGEIFENTKISTSVLRKSANDSNDILESSDENKDEVTDNLKETGYFQLPIEETKFNSSQEHDGLKVSADGAKSNLSDISN